MRSLPLLILTMFIALSVSAHEGHHETPGSVTAPRGGALKDILDLHIELVADKDGFTVYPYQQDMKAVPIKDVKIEGSLRRPRAKKSEPIQLVAKDEGFKASVDAKGLHRYEVELKVVHGGKIGSVKFNVEPK